MDSFYDKDSASQKLEEMAADRREALRDRGNRSILHMADLNVDEMRTEEMSEGRKNWRLCVKERDDEVSDEVVVRIQGILIKNNLVPKNVRSCPSHRAPFLTQSAEITGLNTETFVASLGMLPSVQGIFGDHLAGVEIINTTVNHSAMGDSLCASNRIFTYRQDLPTEQDNRFQDGVDPLGHLAKLKTDELIHAPENIVKYYARVYNDRQKEFVYETYVPGGFNTGDIVELQLSFVALTSGQSKVKLTSRLQALTLLDGRYSKEATMSRRKAMAMPVANPAVRRRVGYFKEDEEFERKHKRARVGSQEGGAEDNEMD
ncbi:hypothetical protein DFH06DRAFT_1343596 [Mycena polygramma]|nr:hypothetical protein DFH06DRAFT_1343596 [Mycena polygramma]